MWTTKVGKCDRCWGEFKLFPSFGKWICEKCKQDRPQKGNGNSGLRSGGTRRRAKTSTLEMVKVPKSDGLFGKLFFEHYPGSKGIPARSLCYLLYDNSICIGIIGVNSPPRNYGIFKRYFEGLDERHFVNNNVFRLINNEKNLGTQVLKLFRNTIRRDYEQKYRDKLLGIVTFVEPPRTGAMYKADNWDYLGETQGKRMKRDKETWEKVFTEGVKKHIFGYKYPKKQAVAPLISAQNTTQASLFNEP